MDNQSVKNSNLSSVGIYIYTDISSVGNYIVYNNCLSVVKSMKPDSLSVAIGRGEAGGPKT